MRKTGTQQNTPHERREGKRLILAYCCIPVTPTPVQAPKRPPRNVQRMKEVKPRTSAVWGRLCFATVGHRLGSERLRYGLYDTRVTWSITVHFPIWLGSTWEEGTRGGLGPEQSTVPRPGAGPHPHAQGRFPSACQRSPRLLWQPPPMGRCLSMDTHWPPLI